MASCPSLRPTIIKHHHHRHRAPPPIYSCTTTTTTWMASWFSSSSSSSSSSSKFKFHHSFPFKRNFWPGRCHATSPQSEPPSKKHLSPFSGIRATFTRFQDTMQIFFAVLFWMSLFFSSSLGDGGNGGRPNKRSRFKK